MLGTDTTVYALATADGSPVWTYQLLGNTGTSQLVVAEGVVYFGVIGAFYALHERDGTLLWRQSEDDAVGFGAPVVQEGDVFVQTDHVGPSMFVDLRQHHHYLWAFGGSAAQLYYRS